MSELVLSLFPGIGLLDMAFEEEGFCVVRGPDLLWGGDIREFHPPAGKFDGVIGGPPCQAFSRLRNIVIANGYQLAENLIPEFERCVAEAAPEWFLMENVPDAPLPQSTIHSIQSVMLRDVWCGGETSRLRRFTFGSFYPRKFHIETLALSRPDPERAVTCDMRQIPVALLKGGKPKRGVWKGHLPRTGKKESLSEMCRLQGLPEDFLVDAILTSSGKAKAVGNGVPLPMGRAVAKAVKAALQQKERAE